MTIHFEKPFLGLIKEAFERLVEACTVIVAYGSGDGQELQVLSSYIRDEDGVLCIDVELPKPKRRSRRKP